MTSGYQINLYGQMGWHSLKPDLTSLTAYLLEAFLEYLRTGVEPYPNDQEVELIAALEADKRSLKLGREVTIKEVLEQGVSGFQLDLAGPLLVGFPVGALQLDLVVLAGRLDAAVLVPGP